MSRTELLGLRDRMRSRPTEATTWLPSNETLQDGTVAATTDDDGWRDRASHIVDTNLTTSDVLFGATFTIVDVTNTTPTFGDVVAENCSVRATMTSTAVPPANGSDVTGSQSKPRTSLH